MKAPSSLALIVVVGLAGCLNLNHKDLGPSPTGAPLAGVTPTATPTTVPGTIDDFNDATQYNSNNRNDLGGWTDDDGPGNAKDSVGGGFLHISTTAGSYWYSTLAASGCFDASAYTKVLFDIRGVVGGETLRVEVSDKGGACGATVNHRVNLPALTTSFQTITYDMVANSVNRANAASFALDNFSPANCQIEVDNIRFVP